MQRKTEIPKLAAKGSRVEDVKERVEIKAKRKTIDRDKRKDVHRLL